MTDQTPGSELERAYLEPEPFQLQDEVTSLTHDLNASAGLFQRSLDMIGRLQEQLQRAEAQLVEAVGLLREVEPARYFADDLDARVEVFLARHAQAEQQEAQGSQCCEPTAEDLAALQAGDCTPEELWGGPRPTCPKCIDRVPLREEKAQGAQAGDELMRRVAVALARSPEITPEEARHVRAALATQPAVPVAEHPVVKALLAVAAAADCAMDDTEDDGQKLTWWRSSYERLSSAVDVLDELPDDQPGYVMGPAAKAAWALRNLNAVRGAEHDQ